MAWLFRGWLFLIILLITSPLASIFPWVNYLVLWVKSWRLEGWVLNKGLGPPRSTMEGYQLRSGVQDDFSFLRNCATRAQLINLCALRSSPLKRGVRTLPIPWGCVGGTEISHENSKHPGRTWHHWQILANDKHASLKQCPLRFQTITLPCFLLAAWPLCFFCWPFFGCQCLS